MKNKEIVITKDLPSTLWFMILDKSILWLLYLGSFGVTRFLKSGPMTMIPKFGTSFLLAMLSVAGTLVGKGLILAVLMFKYCGPCSQALGSDLRIPSIAVWVGVFLVPHLILVSIGTFNLIAMSLDFEFLGLWLMDFERLHYMCESQSISQCGQSKSNEHQKDMRNTIRALK